MRRAGEWAFRVAALALALVLFEAALRVLDLPRADTCWMPKEAYWVPDDALGFAYRPDAVVAMGTINAIGLRGPVPARDASAATRRILWVGDSSAYGYGVADADAFWRLGTDSLVVARPAERIEPIVAAAPGYSSYQSRVLVERFAPYAPSWAVLYVGAYNDHRRRAYYPDAAIPARMARRRAAWHDVRVLQSGELVANLFGGWLARSFAEPAEHVRVPVAAFAANLDAMLATTRAAGAHTIVLVPPFSAKLRAARPWIPPYENALREAARRGGATTIELGQVFDALGDAAFQRDGIHPSVAGHRAIAAALTPTLVPPPAPGT
jgi:lysophospholipase L1-like esterase